MKRALLVGINAYETQPLLGCVNDALDLSGYLVNRHWSSPREVSILLDSAATKANVLRELSRIIDESYEGDELYFHFSGHGTQIDADTGDSNEVDGLDEILCPVDFVWTRESAITDNELRALFVRVREGVAATWSIDACYSGDLHRKRRTRFRSRGMDPPVGALNSRRKKVRSVVRRMKAATSDLNVAFLSACAETEEASELDLPGHANGAFSHCLLEQLNLLHELVRQGGAEPTLTNLVSRIASNTDVFEMVPRVIGPAWLLGRPFLGPAGP